MNITSKDHIHSYVRDGILLFTSVTQMILVLDTIFGDPNRVRDAVARLHSNFQRNKPFTNWIVEIRRDASIAEYDPNSRPLLDLVLFNMNIELKKALVYEKEFDQLSFDQAISRLQDIDNRLRAVASLLSRNNYRQNQHAPLPQASVAPVGDPMDLSASKTQRRGPLSKEEREYRRKNGLCNYCGEKGHLVYSCPKKPASSLVMGRASEVTEDERSVCLGNGVAP